MNKKNRSSSSQQSWRFIISLSFRTLWGARRTLGATTYFALFGVILGVAVLVVAMAVMSGFETTLKNAVIDVSGDLIVSKKSKVVESADNLTEKLMQIEPRITAAVPFFHIEAVAAAKGRVTGVIIQGLDAAKIYSVLNLKKRIVEGGLISAEQKTEDGVMPGVVGKEFFRSMGLQLGQTFQVVLPVFDETNPQQFKRRVSKIKVIGVIDLGKFEFNERYLLVNLADAQAFAQAPDKYSGLLLKVSNSDQARQISFRLTENLPTGYWVRDWRDLNENLFAATEIEKIVIFFVIQIIMLAAAFSVSSTLYISVVQRYKTIAILKTIGATNRFIQHVFSLQGLWLGMIGLLGGYLLGLFFCGSFVFLQTQFKLIQGDIYELDFIIPQIRFADWAAIGATTLLIAYLATLAPARTGSKLKPTEGMRYE